VTGGGAPSLTTLLQTWTFTPVTAVLVPVLIGYFTLVFRHRRAGHGWPVSRCVCAVAAAVFLILASNSALAIYGSQLLSVHMVVHLLLIMVVPAFAVLAQPIRLMGDAGGARAAAMIDRTAASSICRFVTSPWFAAPFYAAVLVLTHLTGFQALVLQHMWIHHGEQALYLLAGYLLLLPLLGAELTVAPLAPFLSFVVMAFCMGPDTLVGVVLMMAGSPLAPAYAASRDWGPTTLADQSLAGAIMWFGGDGLMMVLMLVVAGQWVAAGDRTVGLGAWLDRARAGSLLPDGDDVALDIDDDEGALAAYNARLAALQESTFQHTPKGWK
jgi:putative membrane protein